MQHIIKKQLIELGLSSRDDIYALQQQTSQYYYSHILPALEKIFDGLSGENEVLQIDRVEINLGAIQWEPAKEIRIENLYNLLNKEIESQLRTSNGAEYQQQKDAGSAQVKKIPIALNAGEQWIYYMQKGVLPWNVPAISNEWKTQVLEALATDFSLVSGLREIIMQDNKALTRIIGDHDEPFLVKLVEILTAQEQRSLAPAIRELRLVFDVLYQNKMPGKIKESNTEKPAKIWTGILQLAASKAEKPDTLQLAQQLLQDAVNKQQPTTTQLDSIKKELRLLETVVAEITKKIKPEKTALTVPGNTNTASETELPVFTSVAGAFPEEGLFVQNAGLVLLHPFLRFLFKNTGLIEAGLFISREKQEKAIMLMHWLATGNTEAEEWLLAVPKILCSWPLDEPLEFDFSLTEQEKTEANDLLIATIAQWTILKNTSPDGLRKGFLQRNGKVVLQNENIYFQVEKSAIDILLDHLPWNLSIIKLPWVKNLLRVEWR